VRDSILLPSFIPLFLTGVTHLRSFTGTLVSFGPFKNYT